MRTTPLARGSLTGKDFISTADWTKEELGLPLDVAKELKAAFKAGHSHRLLPDRTLFMIFFDLSTRTRNAFEAGMTQLGGHAHFIDANTSQIAHGETPHDMGIILSTYGHGIAIRHDKVPGEGNPYMREVAKLNLRMECLCTQHVILGPGKPRSYLPESTSIESCVWRHFN